MQGVTALTAYLIFKEVYPTLLFNYDIDGRGGHLISRIFLSMRRHFLANVVANVGAPKGGNAVHFSNISSRVPSPLPGRGGEKESGERAEKTL